VLKTSPFGPAFSDSGSIAGMAGRKIDELTDQSRSVQQIASS